MIVTDRFHCSTSMYPNAAFDHLTRRTCFVRVSLSKCVHVPLLKHAFRHNKYEWAGSINLTNYMFEGFLFGQTEATVTICHLNVMDYTKGKRPFCVLNARQYMNSPQSCNDYIHAFSGGGFIWCVQSQITTQGNTAMFVSGFFSHWSYFVPFTWQFSIQPLMN